MAINKNFVVKNGFEASTDLIFANATTRKVGIGTSNPRYNLDVRGGIGATDAIFSGIVTVANELRVGTGGSIFSVIAGPTGFGQSIGIGTTNPTFLVDIRSPVSTGQTALYVQGDARITGDLIVDDLVFDQADITRLNVSGISTLVGFATFRESVAIQTNLYVGGITTVAANGGITTTGGDLYVGGNFYNSGDVIIDTDLYIVGIATIGTLDVLGLSTTRDLYVAGFSTFVGFSTFNDYVDIQDGLRVSGLSTFAGITTVTGPTLFTKQLNVSGVSTFVGFSTFNNSVDIRNGLRVGGISTFVGFSTFNSSVYVAGISTLNGYVNIPNNLNVTGIVTAGSISIGATQVISSARQLQNIASLDATTTATIEAAIANAPNTFTDITVSGVSTFVGLATFNNGLRVVSGVTTLGVTTATNLTLQQLNVSGVSTFAGITTVTGATLFSRQLNVSGVSTLGTVQISSGIITATTGVVTYYGNGSFLTGNARNLTATIGIGTSGGAVGYGVSFLDLRGPGLSTVFYNGNVGIATIFFQGGSGSASIGIGTTPGEAFPGIVTTGNLWYNNDIGRLFIYYQDTDSFQWVDASPNTIGITNFDSITVGAAVTINSSGINAPTGIITAIDFDSLSDQNYKENINTVNNALLKVEQLRGVKFDWKESGLPSYGVIAQELQEVLPELVHGNDPKTVNYNGIIGVLIEAIKELKAEINTLKDRIGE